MLPFLKKDSVLWDNQFRIYFPCITCFRETFSPEDDSGLAWFFFFSIMIILFLFSYLIYFFNRIFLYADKFWSWNALAINKWILKIHHQLHQIYIFRPFTFFNIYSLRFFSSLLTYREQCNFSRLFFIYFSTI